MKEILRKILPVTVFNSIKKYYWDYTNGTSYQSFSGEGEDMILRKIFYKKQKGFYVDIGAYHPKKSSNTYYFYKKGWSGINIDAMPGSMKIFNQLRPRDINIECPIGNDDELIRYYEFEDKALNGFESEKLKSKDQSKPQNLIKKIHELRSKSLNSILNSNLKKDQHIDFMTVDVEGNEMSILEGFDFVKYAPAIILVEIWNYEMSHDFINSVDSLLKNEGYFPMAKTLNTVFYSRNLN
jgi:FkbM family methyltransferase